MGFNPDDPVHRVHDTDPNRFRALFHHSETVVHFDDQNILIDGTEISNKVVGHAHAEKANVCVSYYPSMVSLRYMCGGQDHGYFFLNPCAYISQDMAQGDWQVEVASSSSATLFHAYTKPNQKICESFEPVSNMGNESSTLRRRFGEDSTIPVGLVNPSPLPNRRPVSEAEDTIPRRRDISDVPRRRRNGNPDLLRALLNRRRALRSENTSSTQQEPTHQESPRHEHSAESEATRVFGLAPDDDAPFLRPEMEISNEGVNPAHRRRYEEDFSDVHRRIQRLVVSMSTPTVRLHSSGRVHAMGHCAIGRRYWEFPDEDREEFVYGRRRTAPNLTENDATFPLTDSITRNYWLLHGFEQGHLTMTNMLLACIPQQQQAERNVNAAVDRSAAAHVILPLIAEVYIRDIQIGAAFDCQHEMEDFMKSACEEFDMEISRATNGKIPEESIVNIDMEVTGGMHVRYKVDGQVFHAYFGNTEAPKPATGP
ncbi:hypothetical protein BT63DRAFT_470613 [Microthyrium microscopicum]|uniref:Uncharacterized protein n=1 Tax=Microthyrium microscopicum TaxID=703497 RepID=A0A6A6UDD1_9PEZI|nr:hypothetical protein BT63DRAFT_470613 [Microthyrium microscopicum]